VSRLFGRPVASLPRFRSGFDNLHLLTDQLRDFEDFDNEEIAMLRKFISTTKFCYTLATGTLQRLTTTDKSSSNFDEEWDEEDESGPLIVKI
jgi:hypothetical protein